MHIESTRLRLIPLNHDQLLDYLRPDYQLETTLGLLPKQKPRKKASGGNLSNEVFLLPLI